MFYNWDGCVPLLVFVNTRHIVLDIKKFCMTPNDK